MSDPKQISMTELLRLEALEKSERSETARYQEYLEQKENDAYLAQLFDFWQEYKDD